MKMTSENFEIECPGCGEFIDINEQIAYKLKEESLDLEKRVERELTERMNKSHLEEISNWKAKLEEKEKSILQQNDSAEENRLINGNNASVVNWGRKPDLALKNPDLIEMKTWARDLINQCKPIAEIFDAIIPLFPTPQTITFDLHFRIT